MPTRRIIGTLQGFIVKFEDMKKLKMTRFGGMDLEKIKKRNPQAIQLSQIDILLGIIQTHSAVNGVAT